jgi:hypothetical protein
MIPPVHEDRGELTLEMSAQLRQELNETTIEFRLEEACKRLNMPAPGRGDMFVDALAKVADALEYAADEIDSLNNQIMEANA